MSLLRGAKPSPRHVLAAAMPHRVAGLTPGAILYKPARLSMWHNDEEGDCVTAEEAFAKACANPEIFITDETVQHWARSNDALNGAVISEVLDAMIDRGFKQEGIRYNDGAAQAVDWTNALVVQNALGKGPLKLGVAANQLENAVLGDPPASGWFATEFQKDTNLDHCVSLCGFGSIVWLANRLGVSVPIAIDGTQPGYAMFTWGSIGVIDVPSMIAITGEAWVRVPGTVIVK